MEEQVVRQLIDDSREAMTALMREMWRDLSRGLAVVRDDVAGLKTDVAGLKTDVAALKADVAVLKTDVAGLKTSVARLEIDVAGLKSDVTVLRVQVGALVDVAQVHDAADRALHRRVVALEERVTRLESEK